MQTLRGIGASPGIALGPCFSYGRAELQWERRSGGDAETEWQRVEAAVAAVAALLADLAVRTRCNCGPAEAEIFAAHVLMLEDPELLDAIHDQITNDGVCAEDAVFSATEHYAKTLEGMANEYFAARAIDVRDVGRRLLTALTGAPETPAAGLVQPSIIVADDLTPSDTAVLDPAMVLGFCTARGGATSHTAILARGMGRPAVVGVGVELLAATAGPCGLALDGGAGVVHVDPDEATRADIVARRAAAGSVRAQAQAHAAEPAITADGHRVEVVANIGNVNGARAALAAGAEGVGLFRTEFLYLERSCLPDEQEQYLAYRDVLDVFGELPVVLRTLDIGGDKELPYLQLEPEMNPFLGLRAIRLCLARPNLFRPQLRAALRAGVGHNLKLMFPMVATAGEVRAARKLLEECRAELTAEGQPVAEHLEVGIMVEIPAAAIMADSLAECVDFFSIGTNDLAQYTLAADRTNAGVAGIASAFQPAVLHLIRNTIQAGHGRGRWVGLCGELAGEPLAVPILLGLGLDEFSMNPPAVPVAKSIIRSLTLADARCLAEDALRLETPEEVQNLVRQRVPAAAANV